MKNSQVIIVMYHYVRNLKQCRYPKIKGLDTSLFVEQIEYLQKKYNFISAEDLILAIETSSELPPNAVLLSFDDAYIDHYTNVFPILDKKKIKGSFYTPVKSITQHTVLDVNKIHFILASVEDEKKIISELYRILDKYRNRYNLKKNDFYYQKLAISNRFDTKEVIFIKRLLQVELEETLRNKIVNELFLKFAAADEESFSRELYMNEEQLRCMHRNGMHIGAHGYNHYWLNSLDKNLQRQEIDLSIQFLQKLKGRDMDDWTMCYPYGAYNQDTLKILAEKKCKFALTTQVNRADIKTDNRYELPRLDTNDLPKNRDEEQMIKKIDSL